ncbi:endoglucanase [Salmonella enterica subsp. salamae]|uniref:cellulase n=1 Tax=Salmonella enterica subsp. salamae TaxID=59202 RepID=A0A6D2G544_SALER|nr:endoglucanase [Salmonella enterica subsp. salamae]
MMTMLRGWITIIVMLTAINAQAACSWPAWEQFKKDYISQQGRVIDPGDARKITTSEGQSYAMFFALAANDRPAFAQLFNWTQNNLAQGSLREHLPAWLWGTKRSRHLVGAGQQLRVRRRYLDGNGRCWRPVVCGKRRVIPKWARRC